MHASRLFFLVFLVLCCHHEQMDAASAMVVEEDRGTICYPNGDIFEGEVSVL